jgi:hypothetical protein
VKYEGKLCTMLISILRFLSTFPSATYTFSHDFLRNRCEFSKLPKTLRGTTRSWITFLQTILYYGFWKIFAQHSWYQVEVYATVLKEVRYSITCRAIQIKIVYLILPNEISSKKEITNYKLCVRCLKPLRYFLLLV